MGDIKLLIPLKDVSVSQKFGEDFWYYNEKLDKSYWFYKTLFQQGKMSVPYHPGIDFRAKHRCPLYAANTGDITRSGIYSDGGIGIRIQSEGYSTFYYHLDETLVKIGDKVKKGQLIGYCDNTGAATTGDHLHFELEINGKIVDPAGYFYYTYNGIEINPNDWDKSRCYHRYYRGRPKGGLENEKKVLAQLGSKGIKSTSEMLNALVYGGWDLPAVKNDAMREIWSQLKKDEYNKGLKPFC